MPRADGTGYALSRLIREALKAKGTVNLIPSFEEPQAKGDLSVRPLGVVPPGRGETVVPGSSFAILEEQVGVRCCFATSDDDDPISMVDIAYSIRRAVLLAGYSNNLYFDYDTVAHAVTGEKSTFTGGLTVTAQADANLS